VVEVQRVLWRVRSRLTNVDLPDYIRLLFAQIRQLLNLTVECAEQDLNLPCIHLKVVLGIDPGVVQLRAHNEVYRDLGPFRAEGGESVDDLIRDLPSIDLGRPVPHVGREHDWNRTRTHHDIREVVGVWLVWQLEDLQKTLVEVSSANDGRVQVVKGHARGCGVDKFSEWGCIQ